MASPPPEDLVELDTDVQASDQVTLSDEEQDEADQDESNQAAVGARGRGTGRSGKGGKGRGRGAGDAAPSEVGSTSSKKAVNKDLTGVKKQKTSSTPGNAKAVVCISNQKAWAPRVHFA